MELLPAGKTAPVDANIFIYRLSGLSAQCQELLPRIARGEIVAWFMTIIVAELLHRRTVAEAIAKGWISPGQPLKKLKADPSVITSLANYITDVEVLLKLPLQIVEVKLDDISASHSLRRAHGLFTNDSINLACALRFGITNIVTHDADFNRVPAVKVWEPTDV